jgi:DNA invertase Pin-like site-specific DNA recombinase
VTSYIARDSIHCVTLSSYLPVLLFVRPKNPFGKDFWINDLGGDGPRVAAYLRVSTERQTRGLSLEVQKEKMDKMKVELKPSRIYWFVDAGISGEDFDRRKLKKILELREKNHVDELWTAHVDRIGRSCRKALLFFLLFTEHGGVIRTPERIYTPEDLVSLLAYTIESYGAETENKIRAERANASKIKNFTSKRWNKPIPLGYVRAGTWITKAEGYEQLIKEIFSTFLSLRNLGKTARAINDKFRKILEKPLKRERLKNILLDPVYVGRPTLMGVAVIDETLRYIDDETFNKCKEELLDTKKDQKGMNVLTQLALKYDVSLLDFLLEVVDFCHRGCGGKLVRNGSRFEGLILQQAFKCDRCKAEFRIPTKSMLSKLLNQEEHKPTDRAQTVIQTSETQQKLNSDRRTKNLVQRNLLDILKG